MRHFEFKALSLLRIAQDKKLLFCSTIKSRYRQRCATIPRFTKISFKIPKKPRSVVEMSSDKNQEDLKVLGTRRPGEKHPDLDPAVPFVEVPPASDEAGPAQVALRVRIDPTKGDERSNLTEMKLDMLESLHGNSAQYVHIHYLLDTLVYPKQGITGKTELFQAPSYL